MDHTTHQDQSNPHPHNHYRHLSVMTALSFISMYSLMYAMVDIFPNVIMNLNQVYMAGLMTAPMIVIELLVMRSMYRDKKKNRLWMAGGIIVLIGCFLFIREQTAIGDKEFMRSMIPHHAGAILMVNKAKLSDPEVLQLAKNIIASQQEEIIFMKAKLEEMDR